MKRGDRVERTGADCTERQKIEEPSPGAQTNAIVVCAQWLQQSDCREPLNKGDIVHSLPPN